MRHAARLGILQAVVAVEGCGRRQAERPGSGCLGTHFHQHPLHIGMLDDRRRCRGADGSTLLAIPGIGQGLLVGAIGDGNTLHANPQAGIVHHREHAGQALVLLADQIADRAALIAEDHGCGRGGVDAQLVFQGMAAQVIAGAEAAISIDHEFRHQEQRNAAGSRRGIRQARQNEMDDVVRHLVVAVGNEDLLAENAVGSVPRPFGPAGQQVEVRTGLRLGQVHGAGPFAGDQLGR